MLVSQGKGKGNIWENNYRKANFRSSHVYLHEDCNAKERMNCPGDLVAALLLFSRQKVRETNMNYSSLVSAVVKCLHLSTISEEVLT